MLRGIAIVGLGLFLQGAFVLSVARSTPVPPRRGVVIVESGEPSAPPAEASRVARAVARRAPDGRVASRDPHLR